MTQGHKAARRPAVSRPRPLFYALVILMASGCATSGTTLAHHELGAGHVIYRISEERAFTTALEAYALLYPKQSVDDVVDGTRRGYNEDERAWTDWGSHRLLVIPAVGIDARGKEVRGYWYDDSQLDATGTAVGPISEQEYQAKRRQILDRI
jgi:hypothetical protein